MTSLQSCKRGPVPAPQTSLTSNSHLTVPDHTTTDDSKSILLDDHTQTDDDYTWANDDSTFLDCGTDDLNDTDLMDDADTRRKHDSILGRLGYDLSTRGIVRCASRNAANDRNDNYNTNFNHH
nr:uncharacterized protein LOC113827078 [Penaeus vannamei]